MPIGDLAGEIVVVLGAAAILVTVLFVGRDHQWVGAPMALATCLAAAVLIGSRLATAGAGLTWEGSWSLDRAAGVAELAILAATALTVLLSPEWLATDSRHGEWYTILLLSAAGAMVMASASDSMELVLGVLLSSVTGYVLASYHRRSALSVEAGAKYFLVGALTNTLLLVGVVLLFGLTGTTLYSGAGVTLAGAPVVTLTATSVLLAVGLAFKLGAVPAHTWVPDVAQGAPAPAAAFLTVAPKIGAVVALGRIMSILPDGSVGWRPLVAGLAAVTMTVGNLSAMWQDDVRRLLGWSSVSQAGYALMAVCVLGRTPYAVAAMVLFVAAYGAGQLLAFGVVTELRGRTSLGDFKGLASRRPWLAAGLGLAFLSFVGIPPLGGFTGKLLLFTAAIDGGYGWLAVVAVANTVVSLFYYLRVLAPVSLEEADGPVPVLGRWAAMGTAGAAVAVVGLGVAAQPLVEALMGSTLLP